MKQYNLIMLGEGGKYIQDCLENNYIGANFIKDVDLTSMPYESKWKQNLVAKYLDANPEKSVVTDKTSLSFLNLIKTNRIAPSSKSCGNAAISINN